MHANDELTERKDLMRELTMYYINFIMKTAAVMIEFTFVTSFVLLFTSKLVQVYSGNDIVL